MKKADNIKIAADNGFNVPPFFVVEISKILNVVPLIDNALTHCTLENIKKICKQIESIIRGKNFFNLSLQIDSAKKYAVRSSGSGEDEGDFSFAGQYESYLNVFGEDEIKKKIIDCYVSQYSQQNILYRLSNGLPLKSLSMSVIVQQMLNPDFYGVAFSVNVLDGYDTQIMYDIALQGKNATDNQAKVSGYIYDWYLEKQMKSPKNDIGISNNQKKEIVDKLKSLQRLFGYPIDVEFAFKKDVLYVLQVRPITKILFKDLKEQFTVANFKDGGVASQACNMLLWSLYELAWDSSLKDFFIKTKAFKPKELTKQIRLYFARPYWNVSSCKKACLKLLGFVEREYDADLGLSTNYFGDGRRTKITPKFLFQLPFVLRGTIKVLRKNEKDLEKNKQGLLADYYKFAALDLDIFSLEKLQEEFKNFVCVHYLKNEYNYFWQAFVNIVRISIYKKSALKIVSKEEYFGLLSGLDDVSHTRPFVRLSEYEKDIKSDKDAYEFWTNTPVDKIIEFYHINPKNNKLDFIDKFNKEFGYHSFKELDLAYPDFYENPIYAVKFLKESLAFTTDTLNNAYIKQCESIKQRLSGFKYKKLIRQTKTIRKFLWWREEFKDLSTRYYSLVRKFALKLADKYFKSGILKDKGDIFHLKFSDIFDFFDNKIDAEQLRQIICKNKVYFDSFVNYKIPNQIGAVDDLGAAAFASAHNKFTPKASVLGVGCGGGTAQGTARVVKTPSDLDKVCLGEIIVAGHFEAGFISKFKVIGGIITETGGALCHSSIIAREYNLPAIVSACDITKIVKTGDTIQINASTGEIKVIKHLKSN